MLFHRFGQIVFAVLLLTGLVFFGLMQPGGVRAMPFPIQDKLAVVSAPTGLLPERFPARSGPVVSSSTKNDLSPALRDIDPISPQPARPGEIRELPMFPLPKGAGVISNGAQPLERDPVLQVGYPVQANMPAPSQNFEGVNNVNGVLPPDTDGDVGPNHYVQMINLSFAIWDKNGNLLYGPANNNTLWTDFGGICESHNDGDPIVLYDHLADRWLMSQFALNFPNDFHQCIAISQTGDPTGAWYRYDFLISNTKMNDYPKFGVWPDGYYMSVNQFDGNTSAWAGAGAIVFERDQMLAGLPAQMIYFDLFGVDPNLGGMLPADLDGLPPPAGAPNYFVQVDDNAWGYPQDQLEIWEFQVDWATPANSTFTKWGDLATASFDSSMCGGARSCIPQPDTGQGLDAIADRLMFRLQYRNFGSHQTMVVNHTVDVDGTDHAGIRWYELHNSSGGWNIYQQGTYAGDSPDPEQRWMGSIAIDGSGNIALGYSVSSASVYPSVRYVGRLADDPLGTLPQGETTLIAGGGSQTHPAARWGDYSMMSVDPVDDCTFWYTQEYYQTTSSAGWQTRIGAFKFPSCTSGPSGTLQGTVTDATTTNPIVGAQVAADVYSTFTNDSGFYSMTVPTGTYTMTATAYGYIADTVTNVTVLSDTVTIQDFTLIPAPTAIVTGTVTDVNTGWPLFASLDIDGYPGDPIWTDPVSGFYSVTLVTGPLYTFNVTAANYTSESRIVGPLSGDEIQNFALQPDFNQGCPPAYEEASLFFDGFELGNLGPDWSITTTNEGRVQVSPSYPYSGTYSVLLDDTTGNSTRSIAALILTHDLSGQGHINLDFWWREFSDENDSEDGVFISDDYGANWYEVLSFNNGPDDFRNEVIDISAAAAANGLTLNDHFQIKFQFYDNYPIPSDGYAIDEVRLSTCVPSTSGRLIGHVYDANTSLPLVDAAVGSDSGRNATTDANGFYELFDTPGMHTVTATMGGGYGPDVQIVTVVQGDTVQQDFNLPMGWLSYTPPSLAAILDIGASTTLPFSLTNSGGLEAVFEFKELDKGMIVLGPFESPHYMVKPFKQGRLTTEKLTLPDPPPAPPYAAGDVLQTWPSGLAYAWGLGFNTDATDLWLGNIAVAGGDDLDYRFLADGANTGDTIDTSPWVGFFAADMTYNPLTGMLWQMNVGGNNCIHELDPNNLVSTGNVICPGWIAAQRGLAYDPTTDTYFAGSWNDLMIHHFAADGTMLDEVNVGLAIAGLAYNPDTEHLFAMVNNSPNPVYVLDAANNYALVGQFNVAGFTDFGGAGLEMDCEGNLWAVDQNMQTVYQFQSGETTTMCSFGVPWLSEDPITGTVASLATQPIAITFDASVPEVTQPGQYYAQLKILHDTPYELANVPVTMTVTAPVSWGKLTGTVSGLEYCDAPGVPLANADLFLESSTGMTWTLTSSISGTYAVWLDEGNSPLVATVSYPGYVTQTVTGISVTAGMTTTVDFDLRLDAPCVNVTPDDLSVTVSMGASTTLPLTLSNTGAAAANFEMVELDGGYAILLPEVQVPGYQVTGVATSSYAGQHLVSRESWSYQPSPEALLGIPADVLLLAADDATQIQAILQAYPNINLVDYFDARLATPTLAELLAYDTVIVMSGYAFDNPVAVGDVLADYIDAGGTVIQTVPTFYDPFGNGWGLQGRFVSDGYSPFIGTGDWFWWADLGAFDASHPIMQGVLSAGDSLRQVVELDSGAELVAEWTDDEFVATKGSVVALNTFLADGYAWTGDVDLIVHNTIIWLQTGSDVPWLSEDPISGTLAADTGFQLVDVTFDAGVPEVIQPGEYYATLSVRTNEPVNNSHTVPVTMTVTAPASWGKLTGTVTGLGYCEANPAPLEEAIVFLESGTGMTWTLTTGISGTYAIWLDEANNPLNVTVSYPGYVTQTVTGISVTAGMTTTVDFDLHLAAPCVSVDPNDLSVTVSMGMSKTLPLTLTNTGAAMATFELRERDRGFTILLPGEVLPYERRAITYWDPSESAPTGDSTTLSPYIWDTGSSIPTGPRYRAAGTSCDGQTYYIFGGWSGTGSVLDEAWQYDPTSDSWTALTPMPVALTNLEATCIDDYIYLVGGYTGSAHTNNFQIYDTINDSWVDTTWPNARTPMTAAWDGKLYAFGGNPGPSNETWMYDPATGLWTGPLAPMPTANSYGAAVRVGDYIYQIGGYVGSPASTVQRYNPANDAWDNNGPQLQNGRMSALTVWYGDYIYVVSGGGSGGGLWTAWDSTEVYDPSAWPGSAWAYDDETVPTPAVAMAGDCADDKIWGAGGTSSWGDLDINQSLDDNLTCNFSSDVPWLSEDPVAGTLAADTGLQSIDVTLDAGVPEVTQPGQYYATLVVNSDPVNRSIGIPVTMTVTSYGVTLEPPIDAKSGDPGTTVTYTLRVTNTGLTADTFDVTTSGHTWMTMTPATVGPLVAGAGADMDVTVTIPTTAAGSAQDVAIITVTSQGDNTQSAMATLTTTANNIYGVMVVPPTATKSGRSGTPVTYTLRVTNTGNITDTFQVTAGGNTWPVVTPLGPGTGPVVVAVGPLAAGAGGEIEIMVMIPADAVNGATDTVTMTVTSQGDPSRSATSVLTTTVDDTYYGLSLAPSTANEANVPGLPVFYTLQVHNTGNLTDTFDVTASGHTWTTTISPTAVISLAAKARSNTVVSVDIPDDALAGAMDTVLVTATSRGDGTQSATATLTTTASTVYSLTLHLTADALSGAPGTTVTYMLQVTNTGNITDTFNVTVGGQTWPTTPTPTSPVPAHTMSKVMVTVDIPANASVGATDVATVTITSQGDATQSATTTLTTTASPPPTIDLFFPIIMKE